MEDDYMKDVRKQARMLLDDTVSAENGFGKTMKQRKRVISSLFGFVLMLVGVGLFLLTNSYYAIMVFLLGSLMFCFFPRMSLFLLVGGIYVSIGGLLLSSFVSHNQGMWLMLVGVIIVIVSSGLMAMEGK